MTWNKPSGLYVCTTLTRRVDEEEDAEIEIVVEFDIVRFIHGSSAVYYGNYPQPADPPEFEFGITSIEIIPDRFAPSAAPLTPAEMAQVTAWFDDEGQAAAIERASDMFEDCNHTHDCNRFERRAWL